MKTSKPAPVTPERAFDVVHDILHEIHPLNHRKICVDDCDKVVSALVCYTDEPQSDDDEALAVIFHKTDCSVQNWLQDTVLRRVDYRDTKLLRTVFETLDSHGLHVPKDVFKRIDAKQRQLNAVNRPERRSGRSIRMRRRA